MTSHAEPPNGRIAKGTKPKQLIEADEAGFVFSPHLYTSYNVHSI